MKCPGCPGESLSDDVLLAAEGCGGRVEFDVLICGKHIVSAPRCWAEAKVEYQENPEHFDGVDVRPIDVIDLRIRRAVLVALDECTREPSDSAAQLTLVKST